MTDPVDDLLAAWDAPQPPADFADRVLAAEGMPAPKRPRRWMRWVALAAVVIGGLLAIPYFLHPDRGVGGVTAEARQSVALGTVGRVVAEPGAQIAWDERDLLAGGPSIVIGHTRGSAFYRVDDTFTLLVAGAGQRLTGRDATFEIGADPMSLKSAATGAIVGAGLTAAVFLTVYDGEVHVKSAHGKAKISAGQRAHLSADEAPRVTPRRQPAALKAALKAAEAERDALRDEVATLAASPEDARIKLTAEKRALEAEVAELKGALADERAARKQVEGEAVPFPDDLPEQFTEKGQVAAYKQIFEALDYPSGRIDAVDCSEFPCMVFGYVGQNEPGSEGARALFNDFETAWKAQFDAQSNAFHWSTSGRVPDGAGNEGMEFGAMVIPKDLKLSKAVMAQIHKRSMLRRQQYLDAKRGE